MGNTSLIFTLLLATVSLFFFGVYLLAQSYGEKREFRKRLTGIDKPILKSYEKKGRPSAGSNFLHFAGSLGKFLQPKREENISAMRRLFIQAGYRNQSALAIYWGLKILLALSLLGLTLLGKIFLWQWMAPAQFTYAAIALSILGFFAPNFWLKLRISHRKDKIQRGLPDALDLMVVCVEAGTGLDAALVRTVEEMKNTHPVLAEEMRLVNLEIRAGKTRQEALKNLAWRTDLEDVSNLTTLLIQTEKFGTSIAQALRVHSDYMRTKRFQRAEELAQKLPIKLIFPLALFILPMMFLVTLGPAIFIFLKYFGKP